MQVYGKSFKDVVNWYRYMKKVWISIHKNFKTKWTVSMLFGKQEVGIWRVKKRSPRHGIPIWSLWPNIRFLPSIVAEKNVTKNVHICPMCIKTTGTCFIQKIYAPSSSLLQGKHLPFSPSSLRLNIFRLFVILSLTQLYRYTPEIFLFSTATIKYIYRAPLRQIGQE